MGKLVLDLIQAISSQLLIFIYLLNTFIKDDPSPYFYISKNISSCSCNIYRVTSLGREKLFLISPSLFPSTGTSTVRTIA